MVNVSADVMTGHLILAASSADQKLSKKRLAEME